MRNNGGGSWNAKNAFERMHPSAGSEAEKRYGPPPQRTETKSSYIAKPIIKTVEHVPSADFAPSDTSDLKIGQKVEHQKFGFGEVIKMEGAAHNPIATVNFEHNGEKKIMLNYAKLRIIQV